ncbi:hypothetical protein M3I54_22675 [Paraburkholderia sp. CNPSo 3274]|uniref:hypothetical protein n=1 Tax=Paraburkholderia sp. CNPSo 3274 TaxID=2940932 RepID=UPI0020B7B354|nr:hypothetical protein [Paraburkholderia sp. CNPSo 3274]MCP3709752.1 hypothetical protein [Paraburkholderia sp. CNPSo 3274]
MTDTKKRYVVDLTDGEAESIEQRARDLEVAAPDFIAYCVRVLSFGLNYAARMLPMQGQSGMHEGE